MPNLGRVSDDREERDSASLDEAVEPSPAATLDELVHQKDSFSIWDEYHEAFGEPQPMRVETAPDTGMPNLVTEADSEAHAPPLTHEWNVCIADTTSFVIRGAWGDVIARFDPASVEQMPDGRYRVTAETALAVPELAAMVARARAALPEFAELKSDLRALATILAGWHRYERLSTNFHLEVKPVRPACKHQLLQLLPPKAGEPLEFGWLKRYCTVRRTTAGAFLELTDDSMRACSMRDPVDEKSVALLGRFDDRKMELSRHRVLLPLFNVTAQAEKRGPEKTS